MKILSLAAGLIIPVALANLASAEPFNDRSSIWIWPSSGERLTSVPYVQMQTPAGDQFTDKGRLWITEQLTASSRPVCPVDQASRRLIGFNDESVPNQTC